MMLINIAALIVAVTIVVVAAVLVPALLELRRTAASIREFVERTETEMMPTIAELHDTLADLEVITSGVAGKIEDIKCFMEVVGETGRGLRTISTLVSGTASALTKSSLWLTGAKVAGSFMLDKLTNKRR